MCCITLLKLKTNIKMLSTVSIHSVKTRVLRSHYILNRVKSLIMCTFFQLCEAWHIQWFCHWTLDKITFLFDACAWNLCQRHWRLIAFILDFNSQPEKRFYLWFSDRNQKGIEKLKPMKLYEHSFIAKFETIYNVYFQKYQREKSNNFTQNMCTKYDSTHFIVCFARSTLIYSRTVELNTLNEEKYSSNANNRKANESSQSKHWHMVDLYPRYSFITW